MNFNELYGTVASTNLSDVQIRSLWELLRNKHAKLQQTVKRSFVVGQRVEWDSPRAGKTMTGKIIKIMAKNIRVTTDDSQTWNVSPGLLRGAQAPKTVKAR